MRHSHLDAPYLAFAFTGVIVGPIVEELSLRGVLLGPLTRRFGFAPAALVTAAIFSAMHYSWSNAPGIFLHGLIYAELVRRTKRLATSLVAHATYNAVVSVEGIVFMLRHGVG